MGLDRWIQYFCLGRPQGLTYDRLVSLYDVSRNFVHTSLPVETPRSLRDCPEISTIVRLFSVEWGVVVVTVSGKKVLCVCVSKDVFSLCLQFTRQTPTIHRGRVRTTKIVR